MGSLVYVDVPCSIAVSSASIVDTLSWLIDDASVSRFRLLAAGIVAHAPTVRVKAPSMTCSCCSPDLKYIVQLMSLATVAALLMLGLTLMWLFLIWMPSFTMSLG